MKTSVMLVILAAVALAVAVFVFSKPAYPMNEEGAKAFFLEDLKEKYPSAEVREIVEILPMTGSDGTPYYQLKARVTKGMGTPCPERIHVYYDYPPKNFVIQPPEYITKGCKVCTNEPNCILLFPEEAIIASHTYEGGEEVARFIKNNADASAIASFEPSDATWRIAWSSASEGAGYSVVLSKQQNKILAVTPS